MDNSTQNLLNSNEHFHYIVAIILALTYKKEFVIFHQKYLDFNFTYSHRIRTEKILWRLMIKAYIRKFVFIFSVCVNSNSICRIQKVAQIEREHFVKPTNTYLSRNAFFAQIYTHIYSLPRLIMHLCIPRFLH